MRCLAGAPTSAGNPAVRAPSLARLFHRAALGLWTMTESLLQRLRAMVSHQPETDESNGLRHGGIIVLTYCCASLMRAR
jgi:hypothetical protein